MKKVKEYQAIRLFKEFLNEVHGELSICGYDYMAGEAFESVDPIAFREEFNNWCDAENIEIE